MPPKGNKNIICNDEVWGDVLRPPHGTQYQVQWSKIQNLKGYLWKQRTHKEMEIGDSDSKGNENIICSMMKCGATWSNETWSKGALVPINCECRYFVFGIFTTTGTIDFAYLKFPVPEKNNNAGISLHKKLGLCLAHDECWA